MRLRAALVALAGLAASMLLPISTESWAPANQSGDSAPVAIDEPAPTSVSLQRFERGLMLWRQDLGQITVAYFEIATKVGLPCQEIFRDTYAGQPYELPPAPPGFSSPRLGFGWLYANDPAMASALGYALADEVPLVAELRSLSLEGVPALELTLSADIGGIPNPLVLAFADEPGLTYCFPRGNEDRSALNTWVAIQRFDHGYMLWRQDRPDRIDVVHFDADVPPGLGCIDVLLDTWAPGESLPYGALAAAGRILPERGFGKIWLTTSYARESLGYPIEAETGGFATVTFERGFDPRRGEVLIRVTRVGFPSGEEFVRRATFGGSGDPDREDRLSQACARRLIPHRPDAAILFHQELGTGVWRMDLEGGDRRRLADFGWFAESSPDGTKVAFSEFYDNGIWIMDADGRNRRRVTAFGTAPSWSPDGGKLAFHTGGTRGTERRLWIVNVDGSDARLLSSTPGSFPRWSRTEPTIAFHGEVNAGVRLISPDGVRERSLGGIGYPSWSADGRWLAFVAGDWTIWTMAPDGINRRQVSASRGIHPRWSPEGDRIAFEDLDGGKGVIVVDVAGGVETRLSDDGRAPSWALLSGPSGPAVRPAARSDPAVVWDPVRRGMLVFGGNVPGSGYLNDVWSYDPAVHRWIHLGAAGPQVLGGPYTGYATAVWDDAGEQVIVFSALGDRPEGFRNVLWSYEPGSGVWRGLGERGPRPPSRTRHAAAWDSENQQMLLYGGWSGSDALADLWSYRPATDSWTLLSPAGPAPSSRTEHTAVWDPAGRQMLVFGGAVIERDSVAARRVGRERIVVGPVNEVWVYRPSENAWTRLGPSPPGLPTRLAHIAVWDQDRHQMIVFGGNALTEIAPNVFGDPGPHPWVYRPADDLWSVLPPVGAAAPERAHHGAVFAPERGEMLVFGGLRENTAVNDLWALRLAGRRWIQLEEARPISTLLR